MKGFSLLKEEKSMKKFLVLTMVLALVSTAVFANGQQEKSSEGYVYRVGFVNIANSDPNCFGAMQNFIKEVESPAFAAAVGADSVEAVTVDSALDIEKQTTGVETLLTRGVDMMFIIGVDTEGNTTSVEACNAEGIPVFMVGTEASGGDWKFIGFNEVELGQRQGEWCVENLPKNANVFYLEGTPGREAAVFRKQGFVDAIAKRSDLKLVSSQTGDFDTATGMQVTEDWIQAYGDKMDSVVSADSQMIVGAVEALRAAGLNNKVVTCGVIHLGDSDGYMIKEGTEDYAVFVSWPSIGTLCADVAKRIYMGETIAEKTFIELHDVTIDNYDEMIK